MDKKDKRHSGWYTPGTTLSMTRQEMIDNCLEPQLAYDEWNERRDGMRFPFDDSKIRPVYCWLTFCDNWMQRRVKYMNAKHKKLLERRRLRKLYKERRI